jgi:hypothetical protein
MVNLLYIHGKNSMASHNSDVLFQQCSLHFFHSSGQAGCPPFPLSVTITCDERKTLFNNALWTCTSLIKSIVAQYARPNTFYCTLYKRRKHFSTKIKTFSAKKLLLKGTVQRDFNSVFLHIWIDLGLNKNRFWF